MQNEEQQPGYVRLPTPTDSGLDTPREPLSNLAAMLDYAAQGPAAVTSDGRSMAAPSGCTLAYTRFDPDRPASDALIVLSHGFQRDQTHMAELAAHLASWGFAVVTPDLCHATPVDNDWDGDAADLVALAGAEGGGRVIYMGHSAGGMRSMLAGAEDPRAALVVGLDLVDAADAALTAAGETRIPVHGIVGEPSSCNANSNGIPVYDADTDAVAFRVTGADHCDFEGPTDSLCTAFCEGRDAPFDEGSVRSAIWGLATSAVLWRVSGEAAAAEWWAFGGDVRGWLEATGLTAPLVP